MSDNKTGKKTTIQKILAVVEPLIFGKRMVTLGICIAVTIFLGYKAAQTRIDAGWMKTVPLKHEYMATFQKYYKDFGGANTVLIALQQREGLGEIYNEKFLS